MKFEPNELVKECIIDNDIVGLRGALIAIILSDMDFTKGRFDNTLKYLEDNNINIYDPYNGEELMSKVKSSYEEKDFQDAIFNLEKNFCKERIKDVKIISKSLFRTSINKNNEYKKEYKSVNNVKPEIGTAKKKKRQQKKSPTEKILIGAAAVALTAAAIGITIKLLK